MTDGGSSSILGEPGNGSGIGGNPPSIKMSSGNICPVFSIDCMKVLFKLYSRMSHYKIFNHRFLLNSPYICVLEK